MLGNAEEHTALSRAISQLAETEEEIEQLQSSQAATDFYVLSELLKDYIGLIASVRVSFIVSFEVSVPMSAGLSQTPPVILLKIH